jgi:SNF2 family DNA or RNA helicase
MATLTADSTMEEIEDELAFTGVLIESLDLYSDDYDAKRRELEKTKEHLTNLLQQRSFDDPLSVQNFFPQPGGYVDHEVPSWKAQLDTRPTYDGSDFEPTQDPHLFHDSAQPVVDSWTWTAGPSTTPNSGNNKRPRPESSYPDFTQHPFKRGTPDFSGASQSKSPHSTVNQIGATSDVMQKILDRQLRAEADLKQRREAHERDAAFAQQLSSQNAQFGSSSVASSSRPASSVFQTTLSHNGGLQRPPPPQPPAPVKNISSNMYPALSSANWSNSPYNGGSSASGARASQMSPNVSSSMNRMKLEPQRHSYQLPERHKQQNSAEPGIVDLTNSDDEAPPSRLAHEPARTLPWEGVFSDNLDFKPASQMPGAFPSSSSVYPSRPQTNGMSRNTVPTYSWGQTPYQTESQQLRSLIAGSFSNPYMFDEDDEDYDDDDDDIVYGGSRPLAAFGGYLDNEDLYRSRYDAFAAYDPTKTREEIQQLLENIRPDEEMPAHLRVKTPEAMTVTLHKYQELGLTWLQNCETGTNKGGILADDMGLGKTIQMLSLIVTHRSEDPQCKTTLIVAPVALMRQWKDEIAQKVKGGRHALSTFIHHGAKKAKDFYEFRRYDVVLTTFGSLASELKRKEKFSLRKKNDPDARPNASEKCVLLDEQSKWYRVILDEAQCIKNRSTQTAKGACMLNSTYRFCMTGTPMMNSVEELFSLVHFLRIKPYCQWEKFRMDFTQPLKSSNEYAKDKAMKMLQTLCKALMLRRTKKSTFEGKPILILPERSTEMDHPEFSEDEKNFYDALENSTQLQFNKYLRRGTVGSNYSAVLVLLLRLRQACCHPHLIKDFGISAAADLTPDQMLEFARMLDFNVVERIKETKGEFECPVCYDVTTNPAIFFPCGHDACSECFAKIADPANAIQNGDEGGGAKCPQCRGPIDTKKLTDFASFKRVHMRDLMTEAELEAEGATAGGSDQDSDSDTDDSDDESGDGSDDDETDSLDGFVVDDDAVDEEEAGRKRQTKLKFERKAVATNTDDNDDDDDDTDDDLDRPSRGSGNAHDNLKSESGPSLVKQETSLEEADGTIVEPADDGIASSGRGKGKGKERVKDKGKGKVNKESKDKKKKKKTKPTMTLAELKKLASRNVKARKAYLRRLRKDYVGSAKIDKTMELLESIMADPEGEKILIFSQWTSLLDLLEIPIDDKGFGYRRYDGSMSAKMREDAVDDFKNSSKDVRIMLISLKAGNAGLNLNMASQVIILDPFWNPYIEEQAIDRAHRIGQVRPVKVHRVLIPGTVEDRIIELQEKKRALISQALDEKQASALARLGVQELAYLFGVTSNPNQAVPGGR